MSGARQAGRAVALAVALLAACAPGAGAAPGWSAAFDVSSRTGRDPHAADLDVAPNGRAIMVWAEGRGRAERVRFALRGPGRERFGAPRGVPVSGGRGQALPRAAIDSSGAAVIAWQEGTGRAYRVRAVLRSPAGRIAAATVSRPGQRSLTPRVDINEAGLAAVAWLLKSRRPGADRVQVALAPPGSRFGTPTILSRRDSSTGEPAVDDGGNIAVVWLQRVAGTIRDPILGAALAFRRAGGAFRPPVALTRLRRIGAELRDIFDVDVRAARSGFLIALNDTAVANLVRTLSPAGGLGAPVSFSADTPRDPSLAVAPNGAALLAFSAAETGASAILYSQRPRGGAFGRLETLPRTSGDTGERGFRPATAAVDGRGDALVSTVARLGPNGPYAAAAGVRPAGGVFPPLTRLSPPGEVVDITETTLAGMSENGRAVVGWIARNPRTDTGVVVRAATYSPS
jgi:hypothetical protein